MKMEEEKWAQTPQEVKDDLANLLFVDAVKIINQTYYMTDIEIP